MASNANQFGVPAPARILVTTLAIAVTCACSTPPRHPAQDVLPLRGAEIPEFATEDLTEVSKAMQEFLARHVPRGENPHQRAWALAHAVTDPYLLPFDYNPAHTLPPAETFGRRTGNCLSFSLMLVAMARQAGVPARFQEAVLEPSYNNINDTFVNSKHINVVLGAEGRTYTVDVSGTVPEDIVRTRRLSDQQAFAQYYNNLGVKALLDDDLPAAWVRFRQALASGAQLAYLWSNLGVVYNRNGQVADAERAYEIALDVDRRESIAVNNLYVIYQQEGRYADAEKLAGRVERHRKRNPYYLAKLASEALESQQYEEAIDLLRRSIRINDEEYRFHGALAQAQYLAGKHDEALNSLDLARALAPPSAVAELESLPLRSFPD